MDSHQFTYGGEGRGVYFAERKEEETDSSPEGWEIHLDVAKVINCLIN